MNTWKRIKNYRQLVLPYETDYLPRIIKSGNQYLVGLYNKQGIGQGMLYFKTNMNEAEACGLKLLMQYEKPVRVINE